MLLLQGDKMGHEKSLQISSDLKNLPQRLKTTNNKYKYLQSYHEIPTKFQTFFYLKINVSGDRKQE